MAYQFAVKTSQSRTLVIVPAVFLILATLSVILRFRSRRRREQKLLWDDWLYATGLFLSYGCYASIVVGVVYGALGRTTLRDGLLEPENIPIVFKALSSVSVLWATASSTLQLAILSLYIRIFKAVSWHRYACYTTMVVVFCWWSSTVVTMLTTCIPLERFKTHTIPGKCIKLREFCIASGLLHVFLDVFILCFPLPVVWRLNTKTSSKMTVSIAFLLGLFATVSGLPRLNCLGGHTSSDASEITHTAWIGVLFQILENSCGVICSCAPMLAASVAELVNRPFATSIRRFVTKNLSRVWQGSGNSGASRNARRSGRSDNSGEGRNKVENPTIGSWRVNKITKESSFGVTSHVADGRSLEYLTEATGSHGSRAERTGIKMDCLLKHT